MPLVQLHTAHSTLHTYNGKDANTHILKIAMKFKEQQFTKNLLHSAYTGCVYGVWLFTVIQTVRI